MLDERQVMEGTALAEPCSPAAGRRQCGTHLVCALIGLGVSNARLAERVLKRKHVFQRGELLYQPGQAFRNLFAIRSGSVKTYVLAADGHGQVTGFYFAGELLDLTGMYDERHQCYAQALESTSVCELAAGDLYRLVDEDPPMRRRILRILSGQIAGHEELVRITETKCVDERLATFLVDLSRRFATRSCSALEFQLSMSREDIASYLSIARETLSRTLSNFAKQGLIHRRGRRLRLDDYQRLVEMATH